MKGGWNLKCEVLSQYWNFTTTKKVMEGENIAGQATEDKGDWSVKSSQGIMKNWVKEFVSVHWRRINK